MASTDCIPYFNDGDEVTVYATAPLTAKTFVAPVAGANAAGNTLTGAVQGVTCGAGARAFGVVARTTATGGLVTAWAAPLIVPVTAGADLTGGTAVQSDANGKAIPWDGTLAKHRLGLCLADALSGTDAMIKLF